MNRRRADGAMNRRGADGAMNRRGADGAMNRREACPPMDARLPRRQATKAQIRRSRVLAGAVMAGILFGLVLAVVLGLQTALPRSPGQSGLTVGSAAGMEPVVARVWVVRPGDTLWSIALASGAHGDIRPFVDRLDASVGGLPLQPGERIVLP